MRPLRIPACPSPGDCVGYYLPANLPPGHPQANILVPCACTLARQAAVIQAMLPPAIRRMTFEAYQETDGNRKAAGLARHFAADPWGLSRCFLTLIGPNRTGKTHLAAATVNTLLARGEPALFETVPALLDHLREGYGNPVSDFEERLEEVRAAPVLVLDDLGAEAQRSEPYGVSWAQDKLYQIVDYRLVHELPTVFTTNLVPDRLPQRIASRLWDGRHGVVVALRATTTGPASGKAHPLLKTKKRRCRLLWPMSSSGRAYPE